MNCNDKREYFFLPISAGKWHDTGTKMEGKLVCLPFRLSILLPGLCLAFQSIDYVISLLSIINVSGFLLQ